MIDKILWPWHRSQDDKPEVTGYMCMIDWQHEIGCACGGSTVYPSIQDLKENHSMWEECGIVEVTVSFSKVIVPENMNLRNV